MNKVQLFFKRNSPLLLSIAGAVGTIATAVLAVKATPEAMKLIEEETEIKRQDEKYKYEDKENVKLTKTEVIKTAWQPYVPAMFSCVATITCIFAAHHLSKKSQASLISAYTLLSNKYNYYRNKVKELYGEETDRQIQEEMAMQVYEDNDKFGKMFKSDQLFFDMESMRYIERSVVDVLEAEKKLNQDFAANGCVTLNQFYGYLGLKPVSYGDQVGWYDFGEYYEIKFEHEKIVIDGDLTCYSINFVTEPFTLLSDDIG